MAKKVVDAVVDFVKVLALTGTTLEAFKKYSEEDIQAFSELANDETRIAQLEMEAMIDAETKKADLSDSAELPEDVGEDNLPVIQLGKRTMSKVGSKLLCTLLGTIVMNSPEKKKNWDSFPYQGKTWYKSLFFMIELPNGEKAKLFASGMTAAKLKKVMTMASDKTGATKSNPKMLIEYFGKVDQETALKDFNFKFEDGEVTHATTIRFIGGLPEFKKYTKGIVNLLEDPRPKTGETNLLDGIDLDMSNWEALQTGSNAQIGAPV